LTASTGVRDDARVRRPADETLDDGAGRFFGDRGDVRHRLRAVAAICASDAASLAASSSSTALRRASASAASWSRRRLRQRLGLRARVGELLFMRGGGGIRFLLHRRRVVEVFRDPRAAGLDHGADARQKPLRHVVIERAERDREPEELGRERARLERREIRVPAAGLVPTSACAEGFEVCAVFAIASSV